MTDDQLRLCLEHANNALNKSLYESSDKLASSYALTSIASSLYVIAERMVNKERDKEV